MAGNERIWKKINKAKNGNVKSNVKKDRDAGIHCQVGYRFRFPFFLLLSIASRVSSSLPSKLPHVFPTLSTNLFFPSFSWRFLLLTFPSLPSSPLTLTPLFPLLLITLQSTFSPLTPSQPVFSLPRSGSPLIDHLTCWFPAV